MEIAFLECRHDVDPDFFPFMIDIKRPAYNKLSSIDNFWYKTLDITFEHLTFESALQDCLKIINFIDINERN